MARNGRFLHDIITVASPVFLKPWGWTASSCRCHRVPLPSLSAPKAAAKVTPTPIPREMTAEEKQTEEDSRAEAENQRVALHELRRYEDDGLEKF